MSVDFKDSELDTYFSSGDYDLIKNRLDASMTSIMDPAGGGYDPDNPHHTDAMEDVNKFYNYLREKNTTEMKKIIAVVNNTPNVDLSEKYNDLEQEDEIRDGQNENTKKTFLEKYLYVILKVIFIIILFYLLLKGIQMPSLDIGSKIKGSINSIKQTAKESMDKITSNNNNTNTIPNRS